MTSRSVKAPSGSTRERSGDETATPVKEHQEAAVAGAVRARESAGGGARARGAEALQRCVGNRATARLMTSQAARGRWGAGSAASTVQFEREIEVDDDTVAVEEDVQLERSVEAPAWGSDADPADVRRTAQRGVQGSGQGLPHAAVIQRLFGRHDVRGAQAFTGAGAAEASRALGARAYTVGSKIAFRERAPGLRVAAHEAAHVVQQRHGVHLDGGVGKSGDQYEQHADRVADAVVRGQSAEALLDAGPGGAATEAVQNAPAGEGGAVQCDRTISKDLWNKVKFTLKSFNGNIESQFRWETTNDTIEVRAIRSVKFDCHVIAESKDPAKVGNYKVGFVQTIREGWYNFHFQPQQGTAGKRFYSRVPAPLRDAPDAKVPAPFYENPTPFQALNKSAQSADMFDSPVTKIPWKSDEGGVDYFLREITGRAKFRTWAVVRRNSDGWIGALAYADWETNPRATITPNFQTPHQGVIVRDNSHSIAKHEADGDDVAMVLDGKLANQSNVADMHDWDTTSDPVGG